MALATATAAVARPSGGSGRSSHPYEAIAGHFPTMKQADAVVTRATAKGVRTVVQVNGPKRIEVEYGNGFATPAGALAVCARVKAKGLPCVLGQEEHGVPSAWNQPKPRPARAGQGAP